MLNHSLYKYQVSNRQLEELQSMVIRNVFLTGLSLLLHLITCQAGPVRKGYSMGCECGIRNIGKGEEEDCKESAKLEAPEA